MPCPSSWCGRAIRGKNADTGRGKESDTEEKEIEEWVVQEGNGETTTVVDEEVNGENVRAEMDRERKIQRVRAWIIGIGFSMGVVGIWGDGA